MKVFLVENVTDVILNSAHTDLHFGRDLLVGQATCDGSSNAALSLGQIFILEPIAFRPLV